MAQEAASGRLTREADDDVRATNKAANQSSQKNTESGSLTEAGKVSGTFGYKLDERMNAYMDSPNDFGCPGNTVDHWRLQFTGRESSLKAANTGSSRKK